jgi:ElaB/YqjD/DUF883 family membrane-anchored ribosome-binding protein
MSGNDSKIPYKNDDGSGAIGFSIKDINDLQQVFSDLGSTVNSIQKAVKNQVNTVSNDIDSMVDTVASGIGGALGAIRQQINDVMGAIRRGVDSTVTAMNTNLSGIVKTITSYISDSINQAHQIFENVIASVKSFIDPLIEETKATFSALTMFIVQWVGGLVFDVEQHFKDIAADVGLALKPIIDAAKSVVADLGDAVKALIDKAIGHAGDAISSLLELISDLPKNIEELKLALEKSAKENIGKPIEELGKGIASAIGSALHISSIEEIDGAKAFIDQLINPASGSVRNMDRFYDALHKGQSKNGLTWLAFEFLSVPLLAWSVLSGVSSAQSQVYLREYATNNRYNQLQVADIVDAHRKDYVSDADYAHRMAEHGFSDTDMHIYEKLGRQRLAIGDAVTMWLRDLMTDDQIAENLRALGYDDDDINRVMEAAFYIPPAQDLITMAVRDVFNPETTARYGQFENYPEAFSKHAAMQGISDEWAKRYWAAHWTLPSPQMGFEMYQRGIIDRDDLVMLLKSLDIMPFWRDRLINLSFSPLTRVDVRRMFDMGVLNKEQVIKAYKDLGYDDHNARMLADFTESLSKGGSGEDEAELKGLTKSNVISLYKDAILSRDEALKMLIQVGVGKDAADLFLLNADFSLDAETRKLQLSIVEQEFKAGTITLNGVRERLNGLGFETGEVDRAILKMENASRLKTKIPDEQTLASMFGKGIITAELYGNSLNALGYSDAWAERLIKLNKKV